MRHLAILIIVIILAVAAGCTTVESPDDQFRVAWQNSEKDVKAYGDQMTAAMGPGGFGNYNIAAMSGDSRAMIATIDRNYENIARVQVVCQDTEARDTYLSALSDLRMACVNISQARDSGDPDARGYFTAATSLFESSKQKRDRVKEIMG
jgi:hypothetical protein